MKFICTIIFYLQILYCFALNITVTDIGAVGDGTTLNTITIQKAIDSVSNNGGGKVIIPEGVFLTGTLILKSNVEFNVEQNAELKGSGNVNDYQDIIPQTRTFTDTYTQRSLFYAENQNNITFLALALFKAMDFHLIFFKMMIKNLLDFDFFLVKMLLTKTSL